MTPERMKPEGETTTWDGSYFVMNHCTAGQGGGGINGTPCNDNLCAPPGKYIATMCATLDEPDAGGAACSLTQQQQVCVDVPFDYPSSTVVDGVIGTQ
jgi:hypothetical protein